VLVLVPCCELLPAASWVIPVIPVCHPGGAAVCAAAAIRGVVASAPNPALGGVNSNAKVVRPSAVTNVGSPVVVASANRDPGTALAAAAKTGCACPGDTCWPAGTVAVSTVGCWPPPLW